MPPHVFRDPELTRSRRQNIRPRTGAVSASIVVGGGAVRSTRATGIENTITIGHSEGPRLHAAPPSRAHLGSNQTIGNIDPALAAQSSVENPTAPVFSTVLGAEAQSSGGNDSSILDAMWPTSTSPGTQMVLDPVLVIVRFHEARTSLEDVIVDPAVIPGAGPGDICVLEVLDLSPSIYNANNTGMSMSSNSGNPGTTGSKFKTPPALEPMKIALQLRRRLVFTIPRSSTNQTPTPTSIGPSSGLGGINSTPGSATVSIAASPLQKIMDLPPRSSAIVRKIEPKSVEADTVEICIKDVLLARDSMWNFSQQLVGSCCYTEKRLQFLGQRVGMVRSIYKDGHKVFSAHIGPNTMVNFRLELLRLVFLVQLLREMWHFEETGEIMFHKLVNTLFPRIFQQWRKAGTNHVITIVLFTLVDFTSVPWTRLGYGERPRNRKDYFRVAVDQVDIGQWDLIMATLRLEFANFKRDILLQNVKIPNPDGPKDSNDGASMYELKGEILPSVKGNILEAVNLALTLVSNRCQVDLRHTVSHFVVVTPGTGIYDVDLPLLKQTSKKMMRVDTALDIICLSQPPLHVVPLFRYRNATGGVSQCVPHWGDILFYSEANYRSRQWVPRCKIYELQMMGVMENERNNLEIARFAVSGVPGSKTMIDIMETYDSEAFAPARSNPLSPMNSRKKAEMHSAKKHTAASNHEGSLGPRLEWNSSKPQIRTESKKAEPTTTTTMTQGTTVPADVAGSALSTLYSLNKSNLTKVSSGNSTPLLGPEKREIPLLGLLTPLLPASFKDKSKKPSLEPLKLINSLTTLSATTSSSSYNTIQAPIPISKIINKQSGLPILQPELSSSPIKRAGAISAINSLKTVPASKANFPEEDDLWTLISNPSKEAQTDVIVYLRRSKWIGVFPPKIRRKKVKWRSFKAPCALPTITTLFPLLGELKQRYTFQSYDVLLAPDSNYFNLSTSKELMREMIQLRILMGFQICYGENVFNTECERSSGGSAESIIKYFPPDLEDRKNIVAYLKFANEIHRIEYDDYTGLNVLLYRLKKVKADEQEKQVKLGIQSTGLKSYLPLIRTRYADDFTTSRIDAFKVKPKKYNWNQLDQLLAGFDSMQEDQRQFFHMKFVVLPSDIAKNTFYINNEHLLDEEIRVEGLRKLIMQIERGTTSHREVGRKGLKEEILPEVSFYTGNLYEFLTLQDTNESNIANLTVRYDKEIKLDQLAQELQGTFGLTLVNRVWHFKKHPNCFVGSELVLWLISGFRDVNSREEAVKYGQQLMDAGLFQHVEKRHGFLDGYYFYEFTSQYVEENTMTPAEVSKDNSTSSSISDTTVKRFYLSRKVMYNLDPNKKLHRPEVITVHYDTVHNPEHCYHIRLEWLNASSRLVDEAVTSWSRLCERYGLKLVEMPWSELCTIPLYNPFHSFVEIELELDPWKDPEFSTSPLLRENRFYFHFHLLHENGFLLDNRALNFFLKSDLDISYLWGKPVFKYAQYIHRTGTYLVELRDNGNFFLAPNNIHLVRQRSLLMSLSSTHDDRSTSFSQRVMLQFRLVCKRKDQLRAIFRRGAEVYTAGQP